MTKEVGMIDMAGPDSQNSTEQQSLTTCWKNTTEDLALKVDVSKKAYEAYQLYFGYLMLPLATIGLLFSILFILTVHRAIKRRHVSRKCYALIINRSIGDVLSCIAALLNVVYILSNKKPAISYIVAIDGLMICSFWSAMVSYCMLSVMKLLAVAKPLHYKKTITMKKCLYFVIFSWIIFLSVMSLSMSHMVMRIELFQKITKCKLETCSRTIFMIREASMVVIYFFTVFCFCGTVAYVLQARRFARVFSDHKTVKSRFPMWKLALNVATFAGFNLPYVIWVILFLVFERPCYYPRHLDEMTIQQGLIRFALVLRIICDPIVTFLLDLQIRRSVLQALGCRKMVQIMDSRRNTDSQQTSESTSTKIALDRRIDSS